MFREQSWSEIGFFSINRASHTAPSPRVSAAKNYDAFPADGVGDAKPVTLQSVLLLTPDDVADNISTTDSIAVGGSLVSTIDTIGDQDFFRVELVAGRTYDIGQYLATGGPSGVPLSDAYIELYDAAGNLIVSADGGGPNTPSGLDALLTYVANSSGTYYINARAYDTDSTNGTTGDAVGDYTLFVNDVTGSPTYTPYYDVNSPLHSIDWGSQVDRTSRNPDGQEGPRVTGNAFTGVGSNPYGIEGKNVITVYFAKAGDVFVSEDPTNPGLTENIVAKGLVAWEKDAFLAALSLYEQVADLVFVEVNDRAEADFKIITYNGTPGAGASLLGRMSPPNEQNEGQAEFNSGDVRWTEEGLGPGGFYFPTLLHEFGHGLGMAHPHEMAAARVSCAAPAAEPPGSAADLAISVSASRSSPSCRITMVGRVRLTASRGRGALPAPRSITSAGSERSARSISR